ncbi:MaoC family dehydratase [Rubrivivax gelatinosus]|uniref:MaoC domain protein dehydratase n=1 Tax=Rubrivivax gelatinosus (strain NBRC 100245 / IL144) TaxID=983917 RepID=I0HK41_RUBGI|nr:MaoC family dehydratase [Rubrivivax gelatinosus]BAL93378.1 MaoC domain protein dehydratase [Rubrivivax gelatinosus IL144]
MDKRYHWEDFPAGTVREFGATTVTREAIVEFARQFDPQPFHVDEEAAKHSLFKGLCASGWHTAAMTMRMMCDEYLLDAASLGSPGLENLRWTKPVYPGDTLKVRMEVTEARPMGSRPTVGLVRSTWTVFNQRDEAVMSMEGWAMFKRREPAVGQNPG